MAISLYDATVASFIQTTTAVVGFLEKGAEHYRGREENPDRLVESRMAADMFPLPFQIVSVNHHSIGAVRGAMAGEFGPPSDQTQYDYAGLQALAARTLDELKALDPDEVNALEGKDVTFRMRAFEIPFTAQNFLLSFSMPNFYFHAATAYDLLRGQGVAIGKRDFMGAMRMKTA
ncbi:MAG TPA: DUF1993 domain-containing protein [Caulobacteraceae bacterium]|jgi:hypothetical protein|nr:DUF1993 domain-containing protein [Caulobacteraceae bacterium]